MSEDTPALAPMSEEAAQELITVIDRIVSLAERHLDIPPETIKASFRESDFVRVLKLTGVAEPLIREMMVACLVKDGTDLGRKWIERHIRYSRIEELIDGLREFQLIAEPTKRYLKALFRVRNHYAHHAGNAHLSLAKVAEKIVERDGPSDIILHLTGNDRPADKDVGFLVLYPLLDFLVKIPSVSIALKEWTPSEEIRARYGFYGPQIRD